jgi:hypothetical protein
MKAGNLAVIGLPAEETPLGCIALGTRSIIPSAAILMAAYFLMRLGRIIQVLGLCTSDTNGHR